MQLTPTATNVPYHQTQAFAATIGCAVSTPGGRMTCGLLKQLTGVQVAPDTSVFKFKILNEGLASLLMETAWRPATTFANTLSVNTLDVAGDQATCANGNKCYTENFGKSPVRITAIPGKRVIDVDPYAAFPGDVGHAFNVYLMPPFGTVDNPAMLYLGQRTDSYLTFFYNRVGPSDFTALADA
jgi:hypothetical protein